MTHPLRPLLALTLAVLPSACSSTLASESLVPESFQVDRHHAHSVELDAKGQPDPWIGDALISTASWTAALETAIETSGVFLEIVRSTDVEPGDESGPAYVLQAHVVELEEPEFELEMAARLKVSWRLVDRASGEALWERTITSRGKIAPDASWSMSERSRMAVQRAVRLNIEAGIERLSALEL